MLTDRSLTLQNLQILAGLHRYLSKDGGHHIWPEWTPVAQDRVREGSPGAALTTNDVAVSVSVRPLHCLKIEISRCESAAGQAAFLFNWHPESIGSFGEHSSGTGLCCSVAECPSGIRCR